MARSRIYERKILEFPTTNTLAHAILVVGGNDCDNQSNQQDASELLTCYKDLILSTKEVTVAVTVSSICPWKRSPEVTERISALTAGLRVLCDEMGMTFVNNDPSFHLQDGNLNDGYLLHDGVDLTKPATNKLVANLSRQLRHGEMSAHADHRKQRPDGDIDSGTPNSAGVSPPTPTPMGDGGEGGHSLYEGYYICSSISTPPFSGLWKICIVSTSIF